jgi:hypothetical protein
MTAALYALLTVTDPSPVVFPPQSIPLTFSHALHLKKNIECAYCHERAPESTEARDSLIPREESCTDCHPVDRAQPFKKAKVAARCDACHPGFQPGTPVERVVVPTPHIKFNHKIHVSNGIRCQQCHGDMRDVEQGTRAQLPTMPLCLRCHVGGTKVSSRCSTCHLTTPAGTLQTAFAEGKLVPSGALRGDDHGPTFRKDHANVAKNDERYCLNCHRQDECLSCHNGVVKPFDFHGNDYVSIHAIDARRDSPRCQACHRLQTFCLGCHQRTGVGLDPTGGIPTAPTTGTLHFHPDGWVSYRCFGTVRCFQDPNIAPNPQNHHAWQAMRNIRACAACHREETCLACHSSLKGAFVDPSLNPGFKGNVEAGYNNPHPPGWLNSGKCRALLSRNRRVCIKCHPATQLDCSTPEL